MPGTVDTGQYKQMFLIMKSPSLKCMGVKGDKKIPPVGSRNRTVQTLHPDLGLKSPIMSVVARRQHQTRDKDSILIHDPTTGSAGH